MRGKFTVRFSGLQLLAAFLAISLAWLSFPAVATATGTTTVSLSTPSQTVAPGGQFTTSVAVAPSTAIAGMQFNLNFDASLVTVTKIEEGNLFKQGGASSFFNPGTINNNAGTISGVFGAITSPGQTVSTQGTFATISLTAKTQSGDCPLDLVNVVVGDVNGNSVPVTVTGGTATIADHPPVLSTIGPKIGIEGSALSFTISATDPDGDSLIYSAANLPSGATFDPATRTFSWTPGYDQSGSYASIHFQVSDGLMTDSEDITITIGNALRTDVNDDGSINVLDMIRIGQHWNQTGSAGWLREDINEDGTVNVLDATLIGQGWTG